MQLCEDAQNTPWPHIDITLSCEQTAADMVRQWHIYRLCWLTWPERVWTHWPIENTYSTVYAYHSCVTSGYREGSAAPAFVPNGKQTHKEQRRKRREGGGGRGSEGIGEQRRRLRRTRSEVEVWRQREKRGRSQRKHLKFRTLLMLWIECVWLANTPRTNSLV